MAAFSSDDLARRDWAMLQSGWITMYLSPEILRDDIEWLRSHEYLLCEFDCASWQTKLDALKDLGVGLRFPDYYGMNLDALHDCLGDLEIPDSGGLAVVLRNFDIFSGANPEPAWDFLDIFAHAGREALLFGRRFVVLLQTSDPESSFDTVGATPVAWNRREWLRSSRRTA